MLLDFLFAAVISFANNDTLIIPFNGYDAPASYEGYRLTWSNEFDGDTLPANEWSYEKGDGCPELCGWGNNELEYYVNSRGNLFFQNGCMIIRAKKQSQGGKQYTSARIKTEGKKTFKFGRVDIRAVMPVGKGIWPAFWFMPENSLYGSWPRSGELDMMEYLGHEPDKVYGTVHFGPGPGSKQISRNISADTRLNEAFHLYSLIWEEDKIQWLLDEKLYATITKTDLGDAVYPFNEEFYLIIRLAVGGNWPGNPDASTEFPQHLVVDYVRVFEKL